MTTLGNPAVEDSPSTGAAPSTSTPIVPTAQAPTVTRQATSDDVDDSEEDGDSDSDADDDDDDEDGDSDSDEEGNEEEHDTDAETVSSTTSSSDSKPEPPNERDAELAAELSTKSTFSDKIDTIALHKGWWRPSIPARLVRIREYVESNSMDDAALSALVEFLAAPVDSAYSSADSGQAIRASEFRARQQRTHLTPEVALQRWGAEIPDAELPPKKKLKRIKKGGERQGTYTLLTDLWYTILHVAKCTSYRGRDGAREQDRLLQLMHALKARPDPPLPENATEALRCDWVWTSGKLWSEVSLFGPSAREVWNDCPGCGAGYTPLEVEAWANVNAFIARVTVSGVANFWRYCLWAVNDGLEGREHFEDSDVDRRNGSVPAVAAWILTCGEQIYELEADIEVDGVEDCTPIEGLSDWAVRGTFCKDRWSVWKEVLTELAKRDDLRAETRAAAVEAVAKMVDVESHS